LLASNDQSVYQDVGEEMIVRRLTPTEYERLQGFPDGWTDGQAVTTRYKQMGNAVTVNVVEVVGKAIMEAENARAD
jgi:DNA (cytosine-5)-methyltransferase 1